jgi:hypothetical protein
MRFLAVFLAAHFGEAADRTPERGRLVAARREFFGYRSPYRQIIVSLLSALRHG